MVMVVMPPSTAGDGREPAQRYWPACDVRREPNVRVLVGPGCAVTVTPPPEDTSLPLEYNQLAASKPVSPEIVSVMEQVAEYASPIMAGLVTESTLAEIAPVGTAQREKQNNPNYYKMFHAPVTVTVMVSTASNIGSLEVVTLQLYWSPWMLSLTGEKTRSSVCIAVVLNTVTPALFSHSNIAPLGIGVVQVMVCSIPTVKGASLPLTPV